MKKIFCQEILTDLLYLVLKIPIPCASIGSSRRGNLLLI